MVGQQGGRNPVSGIGRVTGYRTRICFFTGMDRKKGLLEYRMGRIKGAACCPHTLHCSGGMYTSFRRRGRHLERSPQQFRHILSSHTLNYVTLQSVTARSKGLHPPQHRSPRPYNQGSSRADFPASRVVWEQNRNHC